MYFGCKAQNREYWKGIILPQIPFKNEKDNDRITFDFNN